jgi:hypothetical protein
MGPASREPFSLLYGDGAKSAAPVRRRSMTEEEKMPPDAEPEDEVENPEVHTVHTSHGRLPRWLELTIAVTALITSISSIAIAIHHGQIMEKLVQANSVPYMQAASATPLRMVRASSHSICSIQASGPLTSKVCALRWAIPM